MTFDSFKTAGIASRFTLVFSVVSALILPVGYFVVSYGHLHATLQTEAEINAKFVSRLISTNPELWRYETIRLEELLGQRPRSGASETRRIYDQKNSLVAESVNRLQAPRIKATYEIRDAGEVAGRIEISRSLLPILLKSGILAIFGLGFGGLLYRWLPFRAVVKAGKQLQDMNEFLKKIMQGSSNSLVVLDLSGNIQMLNRRFETLSGCSREELLGRRFCDLFAGSTRTQTETELSRVSSEGAGSINFETELCRRDGVARSLVCNAEALSTEGTISGVVVSLDDATDRIKAEEERLALERHFLQAQKLESLGVLAGGIAHDFNNILAIIMGYCCSIKDDIDPTSASADYARKIEGAANRAGDLCRQMLSYAGKDELRHSLINMNVLVDEMVKMLHSAIKKNVRIDMALLDVPAITADSSQIQQIVMNLIINAVEAIGDGNGTIRIVLNQADIAEGQAHNDFTGRSSHPGTYVCLEVSDNGCGMDEETQKRIFEPFYTTKFTGRGLGMSATLGIIKSHDGILQLSSEPGIGTTFKVYLPVPAVPVIADARPATSQTLAAKIKGTILLVDDEQELRTLGAIRLKKIGFSTITAADGLEALDIYRQQQDEIDLILLDLLMPEMDGTETYHCLREISRTVPIVFCSGCSIKELSVNILDDEQTGFLKKPYKPDQLQTILLEILK
jgi:PAS domain S-box-containing protein